MMQKDFQANNRDINYMDDPLPVGRFSH